MNSQSEATLNHFSHPHPLQLTNYQNSPNSYSSAICSGCRFQVTGTIYSCTTCNYFLHTNCAKMPKQITHPFDKGHVLTLHSTPPYEESLDVYCNACGKSGMKGFCYHCKVCQIDLHILCAIMPLTFTHQSHPHQLNLIFSPPHLDKTFICDVCKTLGSDHWLYRCHTCDFDVHLDCRNVPVPQPTSFGAFPNQYAQQQPDVALPKSAQVPPYQQPQYSQNFYQTSQVPTGVPLNNYQTRVSMNNPYQGVDPSAVMAYLTRLEQELAAVQHRMNQQQLQSLYHLRSFTSAGRFGGGRTGGVGGFGGMQMHNLLDPLTNGAGNGIGGNIPGLNLFGNGGGFGGLDLQSLLGGGFGNLDFGSFLGGGSGLF